MDLLQPNKADLTAAIAQPVESSESARYRRTLRGSPVILQLLSLPLLLFFAIPIVAVVFQVSLTDIWSGLRQPQVLQAVGISLKTSLISTMLTLLLGTPVAYLLGRHNFPGKRLFEALVDLPTVLPPAVAGIALLLAFGRRGLLGGTLDALGLHIAFSQAAVVMAQLFVASSFYVRAAMLGFASVDRELDQAAQLDGANRWQIFRLVVLPLAGQGVLSGGVMSWARALGEFGATIIFAGNMPGTTQTMPLAIYIGFEVNLANALTLSVILITLSFVALAVVRLIVSRHTEFVTG
jgi:molybdate transport system permease protein